MSNHEILLTHTTPINQSARACISHNSIDQVCTFECPELCSVSPKEVARRNPNSKKFKDYTGVQMGRSVVVGLRFWQSGTTSIWVVRCACGRYDTTQWHVLRDIIERSRKGREYACGICVLHHKRS